mgnify:CR=1 FL=1
MHMHNLYVQCMLLFGNVALCGFLIISVSFNQDLTVTCFLIDLNANSGLMFRGFFQAEAFNID